MKYCGSCKTTKDESEFNKNKNKVDGLQSYCRDCTKNYQVNYIRDKNRDFDSHLRRTYGVSFNTYRHLLTAQASGCAICGYIPAEGERRLSLDHCHTTGTIRSLLCQRCNTALGMVNDNQVLLQEMIEYLNRHITIVEDD